MSGEIQITVKSNYDGIDRLLNMLPGRNAAITSEVAQALVDDIRQGWSGTYPPASDPGAAPAVRSGELDLSVVKEPIEGNILRSSYLVVAGSEHAVHDEYGTSHMAARPFFRPAVDRIERTFADSYRGLFQGVL